MKKIIALSKIKKFLSPLVTFFTINHEGIFFASSLTYFLLISLVPIQIIQTILLDLLKINPQINMTTFIGVYANNFDIDIFQSNGQLSLSNILQGIIIFLFTLYIASHGISLFIRICNRMYKNHEKTFRVRITSLLFFIILTVFFAVFNSFLSIFANIKIKNPSLISLLQNISNFITFCFIIFTLHLLGTHKYIKYYHMIPGVLFSSVIISLFVSIYYAIISSSIFKEKIYGPFYSGITLLLTIYFISYVLVLGVNFNQTIFFAHLKKDKTN